MVSLFDPSAFIEAERSQTVASNSYAPLAAFAAPPAAENRHSSGAPQPALAAIATLAAMPGESLPWSRDLEAWAASECPLHVQPEVWDEITHEALAVSRNWGGKALAAGWSTLHLFGCHRRPQFRRRDFNGLVATIVGLACPVRITGLDPAHAELTDQNGAVLRFQRRDMPGSVPLWEAYVMSSGP